jgi:hypothetical protein
MKIANTASERTRKPHQILQLASYVLLAMPSCATRLQTGPRIENFNGDWKFAKGAQTAAEQIGFDDASWQAVRLPHDWAIGSPYDPAANPHTGKLPWQGEGWYRKRFTLSKADQGRRVYLDFDGAMAMPTVYVNGQQVGDWDYGYQSFRVDASDAVRFGESNLIAVHLDTRSHQSRWYPGAGLYRKVVLVVANRIHIAHWGTFVTTPRVERNSATVEIQTLIESHQLDGSDIELDFYAVWGRIMQMLPPALRPFPSAVSQQLLRLKMRGKIVRTLMDARMRLTSASSRTTSHSGSRPSRSEPVRSSKRPIGVSTVTGATSSGRLPTPGGSLRCGRPRTTGVATGV